LCCLACSLTNTLRIIIIIIITIIIIIIIIIKHQIAALAIWICIGSTKLEHQFQHWLFWPRNFKHYNRSCFRDKTVTVCRCPLSFVSCRVLKLHSICIIIYLRTL